MERIKLDVEYGQVTIKFDRKNLWRVNKLAPLKLSWNASQECYQTSINRISEVIKHIKAIGSYVQLSPRLQELENLNEFGQTKDEESLDLEKWANHESFAEFPSESFDKSSIGFKDSIAPYPFQYAGIEQGAKKNGRILIADEMGLGKTLQACGLIGLLRENLPAVITSPVSVLNNWKTEILKFIDFLDEDDISILEESTDVPSGLVTICTYKYAVNNQDKLTEFLNVRGIFIPDEAHVAKTKDTQVGTAVVELAKFSECYIPLTGTPILNFVRELFNILHGLDPVRWSDQKAFEIRYCEGHTRSMKIKGQVRNIWWANGASNLEELMEILRDNYMVRRLKSDVLGQLPKRNRTTITLNMTNADKSFNEFMENLKVISKPIFEKNNYSVSKSAQEIRMELGFVNDNQLSTQNDSEEVKYKKDPIFKLYADCGLAKVDNVVEHIRDLLDANPDFKFVLFFQHRMVYEKLKSQLDNLFPEFESITIIGDVSATDRQKEKERYQSDVNCRFAYCSIEAAYAGVTLTAGNVVGMVQLPWSPRKALQCEGRIDRIGQEREMYFLYYVGANVFETAQLKMLTNKDDSAVMALDGAKGERFTTDGTNAEDGDLIDSFDSNDAFMALLEIVCEELKKEL